jgi:hypothetical protein
MNKLVPTPASIDSTLGELILVNLSQMNIPDKSTKAYLSQPHELSSSPPSNPIKPSPYGARIRTKSKQSKTSSTVDDVQHEEKKFKQAKSNKPKVIVLNQQI